MHARGHYREEKPEIHQFCKEVHKTVVDTLKKLHGHKRKVGFYCQGNFQADQPYFSGCQPRWNYTNPKAVTTTNESS